ncbi:MAG: NifB/NifX family molybdenum-iron cluster-binding protein [Desulfosalsimonadaceae bacterium]
MIIALTVWEDRISPVFDVAAMILLAEIKNGDVLNRRLVPFNPGRLSRFAEMLKQMDVSVLICGAISEAPANILIANGVELIPFISGKTEHILGEYAKNKPIIPAFLMPGIGRQRRRRGQNCADAAQSQKEVRDMPGKDRTGPSGQGPGTGKGRGQCPSGGAGQVTGQGRGPGRGQGRGTGQGSGQGFGQGQGRKK